MRSFITCTFHQILLGCDEIRAAAHMGQMRNTYIKKPEGDRPLWRPSHRWKDNIRMDLTETGWGVD
jgi:hypothetical protein